MPADELATPRQATLAPPGAGLERPPMRGIDRWQPLASGGQSSQQPGARRMTVNDIRSKLAQGVSKGAEGAAAPSPRAGRRASGRKRFDHCDGDAVTPGAIHRRTVDTGEDRHVMTGSSLLGRQLDDLGLGATDVTACDHVDDVHRHHPAAARHRLSQAS
jgi:hypothetical protein